ncbi:winged helix-turn-helix transcriptional regulator [Candidatus Woesearchaeota archaeon]|nr:winged helix-turn-helix transcriptional regulator [Candidatus Woesearchaeota archaeon]
MNKKIAECVGLWLAEGDDKCNNEITFTNNQFELIEFFHKNIKKLFSNYKFNIRIYVYTPNSENVTVPLEVTKVNRYIDNRANKPYYIWRLASVELHRKWKNIVELYKNNPTYYADILRGFFAGEGSIKSTSHNSRSVMISQLPSIFLEKMLKHLEMEFKYNPGNRSYFITHWDNWDKLAKIKIADLHSAKKEKFWRIYGEFKERHYKSHHIRDGTLQMLVNPFMTSDLAINFNRTEARLQDVLIDLKDKGIIKNFRSGSRSYWIRNDQNAAIISKLKNDYLNFLSKDKKTTSEIAKYFNVGFQSSNRRLKELEKQGLIKRNSDKKWEKLNFAEKVIVL